VLAELVSMYVRCYNSYAVRKCVRGIGLIICGSLGRKTYTASEACAVFLENFERKPIRIRYMRVRRLKVAVKAGENKVVDNQVVDSQNVDIVKNDICTYVCT
jgi:hypothetical protein